MLYERNADFKKNPQGISSLDTLARHVIVELQSSFDGQNFQAANFDLEAGSGSKTDQIQKTLNAVTDKMRQNVNKMFENQSEVNMMEEKSDRIRSASEAF